MTNRVGPEQDRRNPFEQALRQEFLEIEVREAVSRFFTDAQQYLYDELDKYGRSPDAWVSKDAIVVGITTFVRSLDADHPLRDASIIEHKPDIATSLASTFPDKKGNFFSLEYELGGWIFATYTPPGGLAIIYFYKNEYDH